ncbi:MAG TPA: SH3 domain-containing protein [Candidatus Dormibacteraeota bacterium]|nr:SH3 domain-containing protein [Candidatus Dormibacteraeota bacterium]
MKKLELAAWGFVFALLGAELGLAVLRPWDDHVALSLSGSHTSAVATEPVTPSPGGTCPDVAVRRIEQVHSIPRSAWIHASDGVNVRAAPSSSATRLTTLATGTQLTVQEEQANPDGTWYRIRLGDGRDGWLVGRYTTNYPISLAATDSLKIWLPMGYQFQPVAPGKAEARYQGGPQALLYLESGAKDQAPTETVVPAPLPRRSTWTARSPEQVLVGDLPATDRVSSIKLAGSGCPALVHEVRITTTTHYYNLVFLLDESSSSVVAQLLDSATVQ